MPFSFAGLRGPENKKCSKEVQLQMAVFKHFLCQPCLSFFFFFCLVFDIFDANDSDCSAMKHVA